MTKALMCIGERDIEFIDCFENQFLTPITIKNKINKFIICLKGVNAETK
jgi:hypothetical protein